jgi:hypothetical protein
MLTWYRNICFVITQFHKSKWVEDNNHALKVIVFLHYFCVSPFFQAWIVALQNVLSIKMDKHAKDSINVCGVMFYGVVP